MAAEGEFPKIDGDILYASEVNYLKNGTFTSGITPAITLNSFHWTSGVLANITNEHLGSSFVGSFHAEEGGDEPNITIDLGEDAIRQSIAIRYSSNLALLFHLHHRQCSNKL